MDHSGNRVPRLTSDGSHTLYLPELDEHYHSVHGALSESRHVFIREGFDHLLKSLQCRGDQLSVISILETGFGTGLNALLTLERTSQVGAAVRYVAIEPYPLSVEEASGLNVAELVAGGQLRDAFRLMHEIPMGAGGDILPGFTLEKWHCKLEEAKLPENTFHLVYHDAFAPDLQPALWDRDAFSRVHRSMREGAFLVTYSAKGSVKRAIAASGLSLVHPRGAAGKREMTRAEKPRYSPRSR